MKHEDKIICPNCRYMQTPYYNDGGSCYCWSCGELIDTINLDDDFIEEDDKDI